jgi:hypothetical protein
MKHQLGTGNLAARHGENTNHFSGNMAPANKQASYIEVETYKAYQSISAAAANNSATPGSISLAYLMQHLDELALYIRSKGETPVSSNYGEIIQAILLRMQDIHLIASTGNLSEDDALKEIQEAESEAFLLNTADKDLVLSPGTQAALNCLIVILLNKMEAATGTSDISGALSLITKSMITPLNNATGDATDPTSSDYSSLLDDLNLDPASVTASGNLNPMDLNYTVPVSTDTSGQSSASFDSLLNNIAATAKTVSSSILGVSNAVQTVGANAGASAISLYLQRNGITLLIILLIAIVLTIILVHATRSK